MKIVKINKAIKAVAAQPKKLTPEIIRDVTVCAKAYLKEGAIAATHKNSQDVYNSKIKEYAQEFGVRNENQVVIETPKYTVGYTVIENPEIVEKKLMSIVPKNLRAGLYKTVLDEKAVQALVEKGLIDRDKFAKCVVFGKPTHRIFVKAKDKATKAE